MLIAEVLKEIQKMNCLKIFHIKNYQLNVRCITSNHPKRINVLRDINLNTGYFIVYDHSQKKWRTHTLAGLKTKIDVLEHVIKDIEILNNWR